MKDFSKRQFAISKYPSGDFLFLVRLLDSELQRVNGTIQSSYDKFNLLDGISHFIVSSFEGSAVGCGALKPFDNEKIELKRIFVANGFRNLGLAREMILKLEDIAKSEEYRKVILETSNAFNPARKLYEKLGYQPIPCYGQYVNMSESICYCKEIEYAI